MVRRGQCRCGSVLDFQKGPDGYKTRCPRCGSVVRLRLALTKKRPKQKSAPRGRPVDESETADLPASQLRPGVVRAITCEICQKRVSVDATHCPACGSPLAVTTAAPPMEDRQSIPRRTPSPNSPSRSLKGWLIAGAALLAVAALVLVFSVRH